MATRGQVALATAGGGSLYSKLPSVNTFLTDAVANLGIDPSVAVTAGRMATRLDAYTFELSAGTMRNGKPHSIARVEWRGSDSALDETELDVTSTDAARLAEVVNRFSGFGQAGPRRSVHLQANVMGRQVEMSMSQVTLEDRGLNADVIYRIVKLNENSRADIGATELLSASVSILDPETSSGLMIRSGPDSGERLLGPELEKEMRRTILRSVDDGIGR